MTFVMLLPMVTLYSSRRPTTDDLLAALAQRAAAPLERARALPGAAYDDPGLYALEVQRVFRRSWTCVARAEQVPEPGDWLAVDVAGEPLVVARGDDGRLRALSRVPHRSMDVLADEPTDRGSLARFVCPYHRWSFRLDGSCIGATDMAASALFDRAACGLGAVALQEWQGFVFVHLDPPDGDLAPLLAGVQAQLGEVDLGTWRLARTLAWGEQPADWKVAVENALECYHHLGTHRATLEEVYPHASVDVTLSPDAHWAGGWMVVSDAWSEGVGADGQRLHPLAFAEPAPGVGPLQRSATLIAGVFPLFFCSVSPDFAVWFQWQPVGPGRHRADLHLLVPPAAWAQPDREQVLDGLAGLLNAIQAEDAAANAGVQRTAGSRFATGGPLSHLERPIWQLHRYLADRLVT